MSKAPFCTDTGSPWTATYPEPAPARRFGSTGGGHKEPLFLLYVYTNILIIWLIHIHCIPIYTGWWFFANPSEKWWSESQLGWWHSQLNGKIIQLFQTTNQWVYNTKDTTVVLTILKHMKVNGKDYPIYDGKNMFETTNQIGFPSHDL